MPQCPGSRLLHMDKQSTFPQTIGAAREKAFALTLHSASLQIWMDQNAQTIHLPPYAMDVLLPIHMVWALCIDTRLTHVTFVVTFRHIHSPCGTSPLLSRYCASPALLGGHGQLWLGHTKGEYRGDGDHHHHAHFHMSLSFFLPCPCAPQHCTTLASACLHSCSGGRALPFTCRDFTRVDQANTGILRVQLPSFHTSCRHGIQAPHATCPPPHPLPFTPSLPSFVPPLIPD